MNTGQGGCFQIYDVALFKAEENENLMFREKEPSLAQKETVDVGFHRQPRAIWWRVLKAAKNNENL